MRNLMPLSATASVLAISAALSLSTPAQAGEVASRCGQFGCDRIHCDYSGNHCVRYSDYDSYYNGYTNGYDRDRYGSYGGYGDEYYDRGPAYDNGYYGGSESYGNGYYGGYGPDYGGYGHLVCDNAGDRCYRTNAPGWNYREYYRQHGYSWDTPRW